MCTCINHKVVNKNNPYGWVNTHKVSAKVYCSTCLKGEAKQPLRI
jgi:hypothetical protein